MPVQATFRLPRRPIQRHKTHRMTGVEGEAQTAKTANAEHSLVGDRSARVFWRRYYEQAFVFNLSATTFFTEALKRKYGIL